MRNFCIFGPRKVKIVNSLNPEFVSNYYNLSVMPYELRIGSIANYRQAMEQTSL